MRTTVQFDDDTAQAIDEVRLAEGLGVSEAVNSLIRRALLRPASAAPAPFRQRTASLGVRIDVSDVAEALDVLDGPHSR